MTSYLQEEAPTVLTSGMKGIAIELSVKDIVIPTTMMLMHKITEIAARKHVNSAERKKVV